MKGVAQTIPLLRVQLTSGIASEDHLAAVSAVVRVAGENDINGLFLGLVL